MEKENNPYYAIAEKIINNTFWKKYKDSSIPERNWVTNLNMFLVNEWRNIYRHSRFENITSNFTNDEEDEIIKYAFQVLSDKIFREENEFDCYGNIILWDRFDQIIGYYSCFQSRPVQSITQLDKT